MASTRPPVTDIERQVLVSLADALRKENEKSIFFCNGTIQEIGTGSPALFYFVDGDGNSRSIRIFQDAESVYDLLHDASTASSFGRGEELVMDESYRTARELLPDRFALNFDPVKAANGVLEAVSSMCMAPIVAKLYKVNSYVKDGFFKAHKDTPKADNHIGTLLVGIPVPFTGGELLLRREESQTVTIDWGDAKGFSWAFFYSDVEHEILPVTSGHRVTIAYDVFTSGAQVVPSVSEYDRLSLDVKLLPLSNLIETQVLQNAEFLPNGGRLAFKLIHQYPLSNNIWTDNFSSALKGMDNLLYHIFSKKAMRPTLTAVYRVPIISTGLFSYREYRNEIVAGCDEFSSRVKGKNRVLLTCKSFSGLKDVDEDECGETGKEDSRHLAVQSQLGGVEESDLIWCTRPSDFIVASTYMTYGNDAQKTHSYVSAAVIVEIPKVGEGCRAGNMAS